MDRFNNGCQNNVMDAYLGLECAEKDDMIGALRRNSLDAELFDSICIIVDALMDDDQVSGISEYEHAEEALSRYLYFAGQYAVTAKHLWHILNVEAHLEEVELSNLDFLLKACSDIRNRPLWRELIQTVLAIPQHEHFYYANNVAERLNIDV